MTEWRAYFARQQRLHDILRDGKGEVDAETAWALVWGPLADGVPSNEDD